MAPDETANSEHWSRYALLLRSRAWCPSIPQIQEAPKRTRGPASHLCPPLLFRPSTQHKWPPHFIHFPTYKLSLSNLQATVSRHPAALFPPPFRARFFPCPGKVGVSPDEITIWGSVDRKVHEDGRMGRVEGRNVSYPLLAQLKHALVPAVLEQFHASPLQRGDARDLADDVTHKLHLLAELLLKAPQYTRSSASRTSSMPALTSAHIQSRRAHCPLQLPGSGPLSYHGRCAWHSQDLSIAPHPMHYAPYCAALAGIAAPRGAFCSGAPRLEA